MNILEIMLYSTQIYVCHLFYNSFMLSPSQYSIPQVSVLFPKSVFYFPSQYSILDFFLELSQLHHGSIRNDAGHKTHTQRKMLRTEVGWPLACSPLG